MEFRLYQKVILARILHNVDLALIINNGRTYRVFLIDQ